MVKRYWLDSRVAGGLGESEKGGLVRFEDYDALATRLADSDHNGDIWCERAHAAEARLAEAEADKFRVTREWAEDSAQLHKRLAEAERLLQAVYSDSSDDYMKKEIARFLSTTDSAPAVWDAYGHWQATSTVPPASASVAPK